MKGIFVMIFLIFLSLSLIFGPHVKAAEDSSSPTGIANLHREKKEVIDLSFPNPQLVRIGEYDLLKMPNCSHISVPRHPQLPIKSVVVKLPLKSDLISLDVNVKNESLNKTYFVLPASKPLPLNSPSKTSNNFSDPDPSIYESDEFYPKHWYDYRVGNGIDPETQKRVKHVIVYFYPLRYSPRQGKILFAKNATIEVIYEEPIGKPMGQRELDNLVITSTLLHPQALSLAQWRNSTEVLTKVVTTDWIYGHYDGVDHPEMIRNCIKDFVSKFDIIYVTIFGDDDQVPVRYAYVPDGYETSPLVPTDLYYADLDGSWNDNGDDLYGDIGNDTIDGVPDVYVGRIPPSFVETAQDVVDKIIAYEQNLNKSDEWFNRILLSGTDPFSAYEGPEGEILQEYIASLWRAGNRTRLYETDGTLTTSNLASEFNKGCCFASFAGHGNPDAWAIGEWFFGLLPVLWSSYHVRDLVNEFRLPVVTAMACSTARFDEDTDCIGEWFVMNPNGGAIGYFGATRIAWAYVGESVRYGLLGEMVWHVYQAFNESYSTLGEMWGFSLLEYIQNNPLDTYFEDQGYLNEKTVMEYMLFGDPSLFIHVRTNRHPIDIALVSVLPYKFDVIDDLYHLGYSYDLYDESNVAGLFDGDSAKIYDYDVVLSGSYTFTSTTYPEEAEAIRSVFVENDAILKDYVETGGGLIILAEHDYSWLPIELSAYTDLGNRTGGEINYYSEHAILKSPNYLKHYGASQTHVPKDNIYVHHFSIWENEPVGTRYGIYESVARDDWTWVSDVTTWLAGNLGKGRITLSTMLLDYYSGNEDVKWKTFYRARLAIDNMIWWAAGFVKFEVQTPYEGINLTIDGSSYTTNALGDVLGVIAPGSYIATVQSPIIIGEGSRSVFIQWSDGSTSNPRMVDIISDLTLGAQFKEQYYLTVDSAYGLTGGYGWKDAGTYAYATLNSDIVEGEEGTRYVFTGWSGDATGDDFSQSDPIYMDSPKKAIANWKTRFYLVATTNPLGIATIQAQGWYDNGTSVDLSAPSLVEGGIGAQHLFANWTLDGADIISNPIQVLMNAPHTAAANYKTQYKFSVTSSGLPTDISFTFLFGTSSPPTMSHSPQGGSVWTSGWYDAGTTIYLDIASNSETIKGTGIDYVFRSWNKTFPTTLDSYETFSASYQISDTYPPIANAGPNQTVNEDMLVIFDGSGSSDNVGVTAYTWTFTDVTTKTLTGENPTYTFNTPGVYTITLNVTDAAGNWATDTVVIAVLDITKPVANAGQDQTVNASETVTFDASASSDNVGIVSYEWDFGDGTTGTGITTTHTYTNPGNYMVTLTVKDVADNTDTHQITVTVLAAEAFSLWIVRAAAAIAAIGVAVAITLLWKRRK